MIFIGILIAMPILFYLLGKAADVVITGVKDIGAMLKVKIFFLGIILGLFTSLPEIGIGINSVISGVSTFAVGSLFGGLVVIFSLILGVNIVLNQGIRITETPITLSFVFGYLMLPLALAFDGVLSFFDGFILVSLYILLVAYLYFQHRGNHGKAMALINKKRLGKSLLKVLLGLVAVIILSNLVVRLATILLDYWEVRPFIIGLLMFSLGTNLPEIIVAVKSWSKNLKDLSISNLIGSGLANGIIMGALVLARPVSIVTGSAFYFLTFFTGTLFLVILYMARTDKKLTFKEGLILASVYFLFLFTQLSVLLSDVAHQ